MCASWLKLFTSQWCLFIFQALREEAEGHDEEVDMMKKMHDDVTAKLRGELDNLRQVTYIWCFSIFLHHLLL